MKYKKNTAYPLTFLFLVLPYGISGGFVTITLPFILTQNGFSVSVAASITALGVSAFILYFLWAPFVDLSLSLHKWYLIGTGFCSATLLLFCLIPLNNSFTGLLTTIVMLTVIAGSISFLPVGGFLAKTVSEDKKGRASGWYMAGNLGGTGLGGGAGIWLSNHFSYHTAIIILSVSIFTTSIALFFVPQVYAAKDTRLKEKINMIASDIRNLIFSPIALFTMAILVMPIGIGAASNLWSSVATDWNVNAPDIVALITGTLCGVTSIIGCAVGGWIADKLGRWWLYFGSGLMMAAITLIMGFSIFLPVTFITGVLFYAFTLGLTFTSITNVIIKATGKGLASTKVALLSSINGIPYAYMTYFDGWLHDKYSIKLMLFGETFLGIFCVVIALFVLNHLRLKKIL
jgi:MFS family permease